ncbi:COMM domain-containing protein 10 isoform X2 [Passer montanus]|uniref:COMM domain-containing protein 10 isoform X2 n=1 Tax=Passer montanus TaxID=9160 RepID=UPI00196123F0|nr:COMM domain-containing protein 10 isoform X2 [Passer montanus]
MSFSSKLIPRFPGFALPSLGAVRQRLALPGHRRGRARAAAMAAPVVPESDSIRRAVSLLNTVDPGRFPRLLSRLLQKLHLKAVYHNLKPASLQQQLQSIHLDQDKAEAFASAWAAAGQDTIEKFRQRVLTPQKLETVGWQLNLQMAESMQAKLKSPQAVLELGVSNEDSKNLKKVFVEFSHKELFEFYNKLETIQAQLDSLT